MECIAVGWILGTKKFAREVNKNAEIKIGPIFSIMVKFITPIILTYTIIKSFLIEIESPYEGYPVSALVMLGLGTLLLISLCSFILSTVKTKNDKERELAVKNIYQEVG